MFGNTQSVVELVLKGKDEASGAFDAVNKKAGGLAKTLGGAAFGGVSVLAGALIAGGAAALSFADELDTATDRVQAQLGASAEEAELYGDAISGVFGNNFADSLADAGDGLSTVVLNMKELGDVGPDVLQKTTEDAFALRDAFDVGIGESTNAANALMKEFDLTSQQAFDFITKGMQEGLNTSGDFLDTIGEYSNQFSAAGFDAGQFFSIMDTGMQSGVLGTDKVADAIKEMNIRLAEGGDDVEDAFSLIGMNYNQIAGFVRAGDEDWADYFGNIVEGLADIEDPLERATAQTAIFGTMAEDLGVNFTDSLSDATFSLEQMSGATDTLSGQYDNLGSMAEGFQRRALVALGPVGDKILSLANENMPAIEGAFAWFEQEAPGWIDTGVDALGRFANHMNTVVIPAAKQVGVIATVYLFQASVAAQQLSVVAGVAFDWVKEKTDGAWVSIQQLGVIAVIYLNDAAIAAQQLSTLAGIALDAFIDKFNTTKNALIGGIEAWKGVFELAGIAWDTMWSNAAGAVKNAWSSISGVFDSIKGFADWLGSHVFDFSFNVPSVNLPSVNIPGFASGADFVVPPGYPNDSFPMLVSSGERVQVTPRGGMAGFGSGGGNTINIHVNDESTGKQLLALVQELRRSSTSIRMAT